MKGSAEIKLKSHLFDWLLYHIIFSAPVAQISCPTHKMPCDYGNTHLRCTMHWFSSRHLSVNVSEDMGGRWSFWEKGKLDLPLVLQRQPTQLLCPSSTKLNCCLLISRQMVSGDGGYKYILFVLFNIPIVTMSSYHSSFLLQSICLSLKLSCCVLS